MGETNKRLYGPAQLTNAAATKYTVPASTRTLVRHIHFSNPGGATTVTLSVGADGATTRIFDAFSIGAGAVLDYWSFLMLEAAEVIQALAGTTTQVVITIEGTEYTAG